MRSILFFLFLTTTSSAQLFLQLEDLDGSVQPHRPKHTTIKYLRPRTNAAGVDTVKDMLFTFDKKGRLTEYICYTCGSYGISDLSTYFTYPNDTTVRETTIVHFTEPKDTPAVQEKYTYYLDTKSGKFVLPGELTRNASGRITVRKYKNDVRSDFTDSLFYDKQGNLVKELHSQVYSSLPWDPDTLTFTWKKGRLLQWSEPYNIDPQTHKLNYRVVSYTYDKKGRIISSEETYSADPGDPMRYIYYYEEY